MSFSSDAKGEICRAPIGDTCCAVAEAYGVLLYCNTFSHTEVKIITESRDFGSRLPLLFNRAFGVKFDQLPPESAQGKRAYGISDKDKLSAIFSTIGYGENEPLAHHINFGVLEESCCSAAFMRGAFLAGGSVTDPEKRYHLELCTSHYNVNRGMLSILLDMGFSPKDTTRKGNYITYFKQSGAIEDFLTTVRAPVAAMTMMNTKVEKDMRNSVQRQVNCDTANVEKSVEAAHNQLGAIRRLERGAGLDSLPEKLQQAALLRIVNPEASISELAQLSDPPVSKSCMSHRLKRITQLADERE